MFGKIFLGVVVVVIVFLGYVSTRNGKFRYERSGVINAPAEKIFPYLTNFKMGALWNPYAQKDPNMKAAYSGQDGQVGSAMDFDGNSEAGSGRLEVLKVTPNESVEIKLTMTKPIHAENVIEYRLTPEANATRFTWSMSGDGGFLGKLISVFINCEKMMTADFDKGISNLKTLAETQAK